MMAFETLFNLWFVFIEYWYINIVSLSGDVLEVRPAYFNLQTFPWFLDFFLQTSIIYPLHLHPHSNVIELISGNNTRPKQILILDFTESFVLSSHNKMIKKNNFRILFHIVFEITRGLWAPSLSWETSSNKWTYLRKAMVI